MIKKPLVIYYSYAFEHMRPQLQMFFNFKPESLMSDIKKNRVKIEKQLNTQETVATGGYHFCTALHDMVDSSYILKSPIDAEIFLDESGAVIRGKGKNDIFFSNRVRSFENCNSINFGISLILFSEDSVNITLTPPYFHQTTQSLYGYPSAGSFDISSWFRPIPIIYHLWNGVDTLKITQGDPMSYINFDTKKRIVFQQFEMNDAISNIVGSVAAFKFLSSFEPLEKLYNRFRLSGLREILLKEIQQSLI